MESKTRATQGNGLRSVSPIPGFPLPSAVVYNARRQDYSCPNRMALLCLPQPTIPPPDLYPYNSQTLNTYEKNSLFPCSDRLSLIS